MCGIAGAGTDLLHLGVDGTRVDGEDVDVVGVGLDDLFSDRSRIEDHGELRGVIWVSACRFEDEVSQHADAHLGSAVQLDGTQLGVVELFHRSEMNVLPSQPLRQTVNITKTRPTSANPNSNRNPDIDVSWHRIKRRRRTHVHLARLEDDPRGRRVGQLGRLPDQRVELVDSVVVTDGVDAHVSVDTGCASSNERRYGDGEEGEPVSEKVRLEKET